MNQGRENRKNVDAYFVEGFNAFFDGVPPYTNPYKRDESHAESLRRASWKSGWMEAEKRKAGLEEEEIVQKAKKLREVTKAKEEKRFNWACLVVIERIFFFGCGVVISYSILPGDVLHRTLVSLTIGDVLRILAAIVIPFAMAIPG